MALAFANAQLFGIWFMLILAGVYLSFLPKLVSILWRKWKDGVLRVWMPIASALFVIVFFLHVGLETYRAWEAFGVHGMAPRDPAAFYGNTGTPLSLLQHWLTPIVAILSDSILVYRTYVVWGFRRRAVIIPLGLLLTGIAIAGWSMWTLARTTDTAGMPARAVVTQRIRIFFIITFVLNFTCAALITCKLWRVSPAFAGHQVMHRSSTSKVIEVVIESAAMYCAHLLALIVSSIAGSNMFFLFLNTLPQTTVLAFSMLILRVARQSHAGTSTSSRIQSLSVFPRSHSTQSPAGVEIDMEGISDASRGSRGSSSRSPGFGSNAHIECTKVVIDDKEATL